MFLSLKTQLYIQGPVQGPYPHLASPEFMELALTLPELRLFPPRWVKGKHCGHILLSMGAILLVFTSLKNPPIQALCKFKPAPVELKCSGAVLCKLALSMAR